MLVNNVIPGKIWNLDNYLSVKSNISLDIVCGENDLNSQLYHSYIRITGISATGSASICNFRSDDSEISRISLIISHSGGQSSVPTLVWNIFI